MDLRRIKTISHDNIGRLIDENLYRGFCSGSKIHVQCMDKTCYIYFDFDNEVATIDVEESRLHRGFCRAINICDAAPKRLYDKIKSATC